MPQPPVPEGNDDPRQAAPEASAPEREASFPPAAPATPRFHELDALRAAAMLLGIVLHAFLFLIPQAWPIQHPDPPALLYWTALNAIHGFRMPVFFLLSGFFTAMLWERRGLRQLALHRAKRIALPLALGCITVIPVNVWAFTEGRFAIAYWPFYWLHGFHHLWFLWMLLWLCAVFLVLARLGVKFSHPMLWWLLVPLTLAPQMLMQEQIVGPDTSDGLIPQSARAGLLRLLLLFRRILLSASIRYAPLVGVGVVAGAIAGIPGCPCAVISFRRNGVGGTSLGGVPGDICLADVLWTNWAVSVVCLARATLGTLRVGLVLLALSVAPAADSLRPKARTYVAFEHSSEVLADLYRRGVRFARNVSALRALYAHRHDAQRQTGPCAAENGSAAGTIGNQGRLTSILRVVLFIQTRKAT